MITYTIEKFMNMPRQKQVAIAEMQGVDLGETIDIEKGVLTRTLTLPGIILKQFFIMQEGKKTYNGMEVSATDENGKEYFDRQL